jgi:hypothetical protein
MFENLKKGLTKKIVVGAALGASAFTPGAQASELNIAKAQTKIVATRFDAKIKIAKNPAEKAKLEAEKEVALAEAELREAKAQDADEKKLTKPAAPAGEIGASVKDTTNKKVAFRERITDKDGNTTERAFEGTRDGANLEKAKINANRPVEIIHSPGNNMSPDGVTYQNNISNPPQNPSSSGGAFGGNIGYRGN